MPPPRHRRPGRTRSHPALEFRPGVIPLRPLNLGDLYGATIKSIRGNVAATMGLAFVTTLIFLVPTTALGAWVASLETVDFESRRRAGRRHDRAVRPDRGDLPVRHPAHRFRGLRRRRGGAGPQDQRRAHLGGHARPGPALVGATIVTSVAMLAALAVVVAGPVLLIVAAVDEGLGGTDLVAPILLLVLAVLLGLLLLLWVSTRLAFLPAAIVLERLGVRRGHRAGRGASRPVGRSGGSSASAC